MELNAIRTPEDLLEWMDENIQYGWIDTSGNKHMMEMQNFRKLYRTMSVEKALECKMGVCIEQVAIMHYILDQIQIKNKMFCCRIYEPDDYGNLEEEEHMHCFLLFYRDGKVYHLEHPHLIRKGIYEYGSEEEAIRSIADYYIKLRGGKESPTTQFNRVPENLSFQEFNAYINNQ